MIIPGTRVRLTRIVDVYPVGVFDIGLTGILDRIDAENSYWIKLDKHFPALDEWDNCVQIWDWEGPDSHPEKSIEAI